MHCRRTKPYIIAHPLTPYLTHQLDVMVKRHDRRPRGKRTYTKGGNRSSRRSGRLHPNVRRAPYSNDSFTRRAGPSFDLQHSLARYRGTTMYHATKHHSQQMRLSKVQVDPMIRESSHTHSSKEKDEGDSPPEPRQSAEQSITAPGKRESDGFSPSCDWMPHLKRRNLGRILQEQQRVRPRRYNLRGKFLVRTALSHDNGDASALIRYLSFKSLGKCISVTW